MNNIVWSTTFYGQSPGDLNNLKNGFAGKFLGYDKRLKNPFDKLPSNLPVILIVGDSIIGDVCVSNIINKFNNIANVNFLQQPHHCKNIDSWLDEWKIDEWDHYYCIFWFDGMHGFPERVTEKEHLQLTPILLNRLLKCTKNILWANCTPVPDNFPTGEKNSVRGPNSKEQRLTNESVINRNISIKTTMTENNVELLDLYSLTQPILYKIQKRIDCHFTFNGELIISNHICNRLKKLFF